VGDSWKQPFGGRTDDDDAVNPPGKGKEDDATQTGKSDPKNAPGQDDYDQRGPA